MAELPRSAVEFDGVVVGYPQAGEHLLVDLNVAGKPEATVGDNGRPREDGMFFGRDLLTGRLISLEGSVSTDSGDTARLAWEALSAAWDAEELRLTPTATGMLRLRMHDGPTRVVYGRPRDINPKDDPGYKLLDVGRLDWVAQFRCIDHLFYDDVEQSEGFDIVSGGAPGLRSPLRSPLTSRVPGSSLELAGRVVVGGTQPAWPQITIYGPVVNPAWFDIGVGWLQLALTLRYDEFVTIATAPWNRSVRLNGVTNVAGALTTQSMRLSRARLTPGVHQLVLRGISDTGTARMVTSWRDAYHTI